MLILSLNFRPTVGFDFVIRDQIWLYFKEITRKFNTTILISTHDISEAQRADVVGFLRNGKIIVENSPKGLMESFQVDSLNEVFFLASMQQQKLNEKM